MMKKNCETCRFFKKADFAGSGWCRHPKRADAGNSLLLVRANELACRRGFSSSLYEPGTGEGTPDAAPMAMASGPQPGITIDEISAILTSSTQWNPEPWIPPSTIGHDLVVGAAPSPLSLETDTVADERVVACSDSIGVGGEAHGESSAAANASSPLPPLPAGQRPLVLRAKEVQKTRLMNRIRTAGVPEPAPAPSASLAKAPVAPVPAPPDASSAALELEGSSDWAVDSTIEPTALPQPDELAAPVAPANPRLSLSDERQPVAAETRLVEDIESWSSDTAEAGEGPTLYDTVPPRDDDFDLPMRVAARQTTLVTGDWDDDDVVVPYDVDQFAVQPVVHIQEPECLPEEVVGQPARRRGRGFGFSWSASRPRRATRIEAPRDDVVLRFDDLPEPAANLLPIDDSVAADAPYLAEMSTGQVGSDVVACNNSEITVDTSEHGGRHVPDAGVLLERRDDTPVQPVIAVLEGRPSGPSGLSGFDTHQVERVDAGVIPYQPQADVLPGSSGPIVYDEALDRYTIAPEVPRMCRTCLHFRPAGGGDHGRCALNRAFAVPRIVAGDDLACAGSFGPWWLPRDDVWIDGYVERHAAPTPLVDEMLSRRDPVVTRPRRAERRPRWS